MSMINNATVLITGGASGIGKLMGSAVIEKGCRALILWDVNQRLLEETIAAFSLRHNNVTTLSRTIQV